jgi:hypothetical protein
MLTGRFYLPPFDLQKGAIFGHLHNQKAIAGAKMAVNMHAVTGRQGYAIGHRHPSKICLLK